MAIHLQIAPLCVIERRSFCFLPEVLEIICFVGRQIIICLLIH